MAKLSFNRVFHPLRVIFLSLIVYGFSSQNSQLYGQSEGWAGGEIVLEYVKGNCNGLSATNALSYDVILKFYRDDFGVTAPALPATKEVMIYSPDNNISFANAFPHQLTLIPNSQRSVVQYCLKGNPVATEGAWYRSTASFEITQKGTWYFYYVGEFDGDYRSSEDRNIVLGQQFFIETRFDLDCGWKYGTTFDGQNYIPDSCYTEAPHLTPTEYVFEDPVASFCVGKDYEFNLKAIKGNDITELEFAFSPIWKGKNQLAQYNTGEGYTITSPFPSTQGIDQADLEDRGILRFRAAEPFAGPVPFLVRNYFTVCDTLEGDVNKELVPQRRLAIMTQREYRFIFDRNCNSRLPDFEFGVYEEANPGIGDYTFFETFNGAQQAYEFDCGTDTFYIKLSEPVLIESLGIIGVDYKQQDQGFRFASIGVGTDPNNPFLDDIPIEQVEPYNVVNIDETDLLRVTLSREKGVGPGRYYFYMKKGDDLNTLVNRCESMVPEFDTLAEIYINGNFTYNHREEQYTYCFPAAVAPEARINLSNPDYVGWSYFGEKRPIRPGTPQSGFPQFTADDTIFFDTTYLGPKRFRLDQPDNEDWVNSKIFIGAGWWRVGAGYDYSTFDKQTGQIIERRVCYGEDLFYVDTITVEDLEIPNFDLCPREDLPVIDLTAYNKDIISSSFDWGKWDGVSEKLFYSQFTDPNFNPPLNQPDSLGRDYQTVSTQPYIFDTKGAFANVGDTNYFRAKFQMKGKYRPDRTCPVQVEFKVLKQLVEVELNYPRDSVICEGEQYVLRNIASNNYFIPEQYTNQWYLDGVPLPNDTTDTLLITTTGNYVLEVTKTTDSSSCVEYDSVFVRVAEFINGVAPSCTEITFKDGNIEQLFAWNPVADINDYEARTVSDPAFGGGPDLVYGQWEPANDLYGIMHRVQGARLGLEVRAVNVRVDESAICRYSDTAFAKPCDAIVKPTNVFTPNGDGINDLLRFDLVEVYPGTSLQLFNRWGKLIYSSDNYLNDWDGENYKEGTYFYVLDINDPNQGTLKGTFTIIRD